MAEIKIAENDDELMDDAVLVKTLRAGGYINGTGRYYETLIRAADRIEELTRAVEMIRNIMQEVGGFD